MPEPPRHMVIFTLCVYSVSETDTGLVSMNFLYERLFSTEKEVDDYIRIEEVDGVCCVREWRRDVIDGYWAEYIDFDKRDERNRYKN